MKLSIVSKTKTNAHVKDILRAAKESGVEANVVVFNSVNEIKKKIEELGDVVYWRASRLDISSERSSLGKLMGDRFVINQAIFDNPYVTHKYYQQALMGKYKSIKTIPTYRYRQRQEILSAIDKGTLEYPFIAKPNLGARGRGVIVIKGVKDIAKIPAYKDYVFQNYIKNTCDWRVIVMGGRPVGVMKRTPTSGNYLNNISQGGIASVETDERVVKKVTDIALHAASVLELSFCGIDIIRDEASKEYYFLEANTALQWATKNGFQATTGINVSKQLVEYASRLSARRENSTGEAVRQYLDIHIDSVPNRSFHYYSRLYLWSDDAAAYEQLKKLQGDYIGTTPKQIRARLNSIKTHSFEPYTSAISPRLEQMSKYSELRRYNSLLFKVLFAETIYGVDIRPYVRELGLDGEMKQTYKKIVKDEKAICAISTRAVNFLFLLPFYLNGDQYLSKHKVDPEMLLRLAKKLPKVLAEEGLAKDKQMRLKNYLLSHTIICASLFYARQVRGHVYRRIIETLEHEIRSNYFSVTLDQKLEFLVCARLCNYRTDLTPIIQDEANMSFSNRGNYLVDRFSRPVNDTSTLDRLDKAEHRNVLYLMAMTPYTKKRHMKTRKSAISSKKLVLGRLPKVDLPSLGLYGLKARTDSGAFFNVLHCSYIHESEGVLEFKVLDPAHPQYRNKKITFSSYRKTVVKNTSGKYEDRYIIDTEIVIAGEKYPTSFTLADRKNMMFPVLVGRSFLKNRFLIDVSKR